MIRVEDLTLQHVKSAHEDIRMEDRMEWLAAGGVDVIEHFEVHPPQAGDRVALDEGGNVMCLWGSRGDPAHVWLVATDSAVPRARAIHRHLKSELSVILERHPTIECWADSRNVKHHEWLHWLGFEYVTEEFYGVLGLPFKHFIKRT